MKLIPLMIALSVSLTSSLAQAHMLNTLYYQVCGQEAKDFALKMGHKSSFFTHGKQFFAPVKDFDLMKKDYNLYGSNMFSHNTYRDVVLGAFLQGHKGEEIVPYIAAMENSGMAVYFHKQDGCVRFISGDLIPATSITAKSFMANSKNVASLDKSFDQYKAHHDVNELASEYRTYRMNFNPASPPSLPDTDPLAAKDTSGSVGH